MRCLPLAQQQSHKGGICPPAASIEGSLAVCRKGEGLSRQVGGALAVGGVLTC